MERLGEGAQSLFNGRDAEAFWFRRIFVRQVGLTCRLFTPKFHFLFLGHFCDGHTLHIDGRMAKIIIPVANTLRVLMTLL